MFMIYTAVLLCQYRATAGYAAIHLIAAILAIYTEGSSPSPHVGYVIKLSTRQSLVYDGLRYPTLKAYSSINSDTRN